MPKYGLFRPFLFIFALIYSKPYQYPASECKNQDYGTRHKIVLKRKPSPVPCAAAFQETENRPLSPSKISRVHKLFTKQERFWNAAVSLRERQVRIVVTSRQAKAACGKIIEHIFMEELKDVL